MIALLKDIHHIFLKLANAMPDKKERCFKGLTEAWPSHLCQRLTKFASLFICGCLVHKGVVECTLSAIEVR